MTEPLPDLLTLADYNGVWDNYEEAIYDCYLTELVEANLVVV